MPSFSIPPPFSLMMPPVIRRRASRTTPLTDMTLPTPLALNTGLRRNDVGLPMSVRSFEIVKFPTQTFLTVIVSPASAASITPWRSGLLATFFVMFLARQPVVDALAVEPDAASPPVARADVINNASMRRVRPLPPRR